MQTRNSHGATLALVATAAVILILIGIGIFYLLQEFGGFREMQHATDAGNLNVAKQALKTPNFVIANDYQLDFNGLIDGTNGMDLLVYNRPVAQAFMVAMNAMADRPQGNAGGSPSVTGLQNAMIVSQAANGGDPSNSSNVGLGQTLYQAFSLKSSNQLFAKFSYVAQSNGARMLGDSQGNQLTRNDAQYDISFMEPNGPTNVWLNTDALPYVGDTGNKMGSGGYPLPANALSTQKNSAGYAYLAGYTNIPMGAAGTSWNLVGVPVFPGRQPHHVAGRDFFEAKAANDSKFQGIVPPNAFKSVTNGANQTSTNAAQMEAYSLVGTMNQDYGVSVPNGYIEIDNPPGYGGQTIGPPDSVYANELMNGIYLGSLSNGDTAFSTDPNVLNQWKAYNSDPVNNPKPPLTDPATGQPLVFFAPSANGAPLSGSDQPSMISGSAGTPCFWTDVQGPSASAPCSNLDNAFNQAYPPSNNFVPTPQPDQMTAVEKLKHDIIVQFRTCGTVSCPAPITLPDGTLQEGTGLRYWTSRAGTGTQVTHPLDPSNPADQSPISPGSQVKISVPGTIDQLIKESVPAQENNILRQLAQRMHEIDPNTAEATAINWLQTNPATFELNTVNYIYYNDPATHATNPGWQLTTAPPPGKHAVLDASGNPHAMVADGSLQRYPSDPIQANNVGGYQTIPNMVDPKFENGIHLEYFTAFPDPSVTSRGIDVIDWNPSSGYANLLGTLTFRNFCSGALAGTASQAGGGYCAPD